MDELSYSELFGVDSSADDFDEEAFLAALCDMEMSGVELPDNWGITNTNY